MKKRILIIHGWESNSKEHWFQEAKAGLEKLNYKVLAPDMPNAFSPKKEEWVKIIEDFNPDENSILIGHSLGGTAILRYLEKAAGRAGQCIFIATPIRKTEYEEINNFFEPDFDWKKIKENSDKFAVLNQKGDMTVNYREGKELAGHLKAEFILIEGNDHFDKIDFSLLEKIILKTS